MIVYIQHTGGERPQRCETVPTWLEQVVATITAAGWRGIWILTDDGVVQRPAAKCCYGPFRE